MTLHASCVAISGKGVLLLGPSGAGKSDLALRLMDGGARLVADDRCELFLRAGHLHARAPKSIAGLIELRGIGIISVPHAKYARLAMAVMLGPQRQRLPHFRPYQPPAPLKAAKLPLISVNPLAASAPALIRAALRAFSGNHFRDTFNPD